MNKSFEGLLLNSTLIISGILWFVWIIYTQGHMWTAIFAIVLLALMSI